MTLAKIQSAFWWCADVMSPNKSASRRLVEEALGDRYQIESELGEGSFGSVYRAKDKFLNRMVAIKSVRLDTAPDRDLQEEMRNRFLREARVAAQLRHPNIVTIYDIVSTPQASLIIMELVEGVTLQSVLGSKKLLGLDETIDILSQTAKALDYAHEHKVVHRDVKPANILITPAKEVRVTDFGIAKTEVSELTLAGTILGTPDYMSPEQAKGEAVDARSDLFSLGCVLYECLVGDQPFRSGNITGVLLRIIDDRPPDVDWPSLGLPAGLDGVVAQALAKDPSERYPSGEALVQALGSLPRPVEEEAGIGTDNKSHGCGSTSTETSGAEAAPSEPLHLKSLRKEERPLGFSASSQEVLGKLNLSKDEAYIISRIDGQVRPGDILAATPGAERETARALLGLIEAGLIKFEDNGGPKEQAIENHTPGDDNLPDEAALLEINDLYELSRSQDHAQILGVENAADPKEIECAFKEKFVRYSPETYPHIDDPEFRQKLRHLLKSAYDAFIALSKQAGDNSRPQAPAAAPRRPQNGNQLEEEIFERAEIAFLKQDYWETIQLCRHAIEHSGENPKFHHLLGMALRQNVNWQEEAKESLQRAAELDPENPEYVAALENF
jgi:serine/threonine protein kinase